MRKLLFLIILNQMIKPAIGQSHFSKENLSKMTYEELLKKNKEITNQFEQSKKELNSILEKNNLLCKKKQELQQKCPWTNYISSFAGVMDLCNQIAETKIDIFIKNGNNQYYFLIANNNYQTQLFNKEGQNTVEFKRTDHNLVTPPKFSEIIDLEIVSSLKDGQTRMEIPKNIEIKIAINNKLILENFSLYETEDNLDLSKKKINQKLFFNLTNKKDCQLNIIQIMNIEKL